MVAEPMTAPSGMLDTTKRTHMNLCDPAVPSALSASPLLPLVEFGDTWFVQASSRPLTEAGAACIEEASRKGPGTPVDRAWATNEATITADRACPSIRKFVRD